jgi:transcriptional regulator with XRE-family HTH domain
MNISGKNISRIRRKLGLTQAELQQRCKRRGLSISRPVIAKIETGARSVSDKELVAFANALNVRVTLLLAGARSGQY